MSEHVKDVSDNSFEADVLKSDRPVLVDFWAQWCAPCRMLAPTVEAVAEKYAGNATVVKLNVDDNPSVSQRYGTVPVVRATGGLDDTVENFDRARGTGNGFKFGPYRADALLGSVYEALYCYTQPHVWRRIQLNGMAEDNSWEAAARRYVEIYQAVAGL